MNDIKVIVGAATKVLVSGIAALAIQPVLAEPHVFGVLTRSAEAAALIGTVAGAVLTVGYANHRLQTWHSQRPVMPMPSQVYAAMAGMTPALQQTAAHVMTDERVAEPDDTDRQWLNAVQRFCVIGSTRRSFGWHAMKHHVDRPGWDTITAKLAGCGVIRMGSGRRPTLYAEGWDSAKVRVALKHGWLDIPTPETLPVVRW